MRAVHTKSKCNPKAYVLTPLTVFERTFLFAESEFNCRRVAFLGETGCGEAWCFKIGRQ